MWKGTVSAILSLIIIIVVVVMFNMRGPDMTPYLALKDPALRTMKPLRVLVVEAKGAPEEAGKKAFGLLMKTYFGTKGVPKGKGMSAPRARWPVPASASTSEWIGRYAMVIPDTLKNIRLPAAGGGLSMYTTTWEYGQVAEILHVGSYDTEGPDIKRLHDFISSQGYVIAGEHEEEYLRGPTMFFKGNPEKYCTIIRYQVKKADSTVGGQ